MTKSNQAVLLTIGQSEYKALDGITMAYAQGFETLGYHAICLDLTRPDWITQFHEYEKKYSIKLALGMSGIGLDIKTNKGNLWELCKIPFINVFCDHPCYFLQRHCYPLQNMSLMPMTPKTGLIFMPILSNHPILPIIIVFLYRHL